jgi:hypothetical protein
MTNVKTARRRGVRSITRDPQVEWLGGRLRLPSYVLEDEPYRPELVVWLEVPSGLVVGHGDDGDGALARALHDALKQSMQGAAREPAKLRVADHADAVELRHAFGDRFDIQVAPTPELEAVFEQLLEYVPKGDEQASYLEGGRVSAPVVSRMFQAAALLIEPRRGKSRPDDEVLRMDIPALGMRGHASPSSARWGRALASSCSRPSWLTNALAQPPNKQSHEPISESSTMNDIGITVRLTAPYEAADAFASVKPSATGQVESKPSGLAGKIGRNKPYPCGSGKKYKKCCLSAEDSERTQERRQATSSRSRFGYGSSRRATSPQRLVNRLRSLEYCAKRGVHCLRVGKRLGHVGGQDGELGTELGDKRPDRELAASSGRNARCVRVRSPATSARVGASPSGRAGGLR